MREPSFSAAPEILSFKGLLFDFDGTEYCPFPQHPFRPIAHSATGTIIDSTDAIVKHWHK
jgi:hypothetical protein